MIPEILDYYHVTTMNNRNLLHDAQFSSCEIKASMGVVAAISCFLCVPFVLYVNVFFHILHVFSRRM